MAKITVEIPDELVARFEAAQKAYDELPKLDQDGARWARAEVFRELAIVADLMGGVLGGTPVLRRMCTAAWARWDGQAARWAEHAERRP
ncbi:hypothetical protein [Labedaea rhizosphaerae]|uniref:Uncharacterized protein n=1 Tax=Labedaea rhizosphaerae TaxID=598644 RepID=A0A4R6SF13_LABRH|nr:hypothetical protein [Labedaea rhizosphaerae]TDP97676.1 hypothetical protein EV186_103640 [Labedaea rhizosphaerae]